MVRQLLEYLPPVVRNVREYRAIMNGAQQEEIARLWEAVDTAFCDQFVLTASLQAVLRWEAILGIMPKGTDSLDDRRFRILARLTEQLPYTLPSLHNMLSALCGPDGFDIIVESEHFSLTVKLALSAKSNLQDAEALLHKVVPANMVIEVLLKYNTWGQIEKLTWGELSHKTWREVYEEVL